MPKTSRNRRCHRSIEEEEVLFLPGLHRNRNLQIVTDINNALAEFYKPDPSTYQELEERMLKKIKEVGKENTALTNWCYLGHAFREESKRNLLGVNHWSKLQPYQSRIAVFLSTIFEKREDAINYLATTATTIGKLTTEDLRYVRQEVLRTYPHRTNIVADINQNSLATVLPPVKELSTID